MKTDRSTMRIIFLLIFCCSMACAKVPKHRVEVRELAQLQEYFRYDPQKDIIISGHRGGMSDGFPENCIASCDETLRLMPSFFEIDPRLTKDNVLVLMHDKTLDRTTTGHGHVSDYTYKELKKLRLKDRQGNITRYRIPTLDQMLEWGNGKTVFNFDNKEVPWELYAQMLNSKWSHYSNIILSVRSLKEALFFYERCDKVMFCVEISNMQMYESYKNSGIPWNRIMAYVKYNMDPTQKELYSLLHSHGVMCMISIPSTTDRLNHEQARIEGYKDELATQPDIIETDYPSEFVSLPLLKGVIK